MNQLLSPYSNARFIAIRLVPGEDVILTLRQKLSSMAYKLHLLSVVSAA